MPLLEIVPEAGSDTRVPGTFPSMKKFRQLSLAIRQRLPEPVRQGLRIAKHVTAGGGQASAHLPPELLADCRFSASRYDLLQVLPHGGRIIEVGTQRGLFAARILADCRPAQLHLVDLDFGFLDPAVRADARVTLHNGLSHDVLASFPDDHFDWIYIDADHSYAGVARDAAAAASKVKPGGYLVFNDFAHAERVCVLTSPGACLYGMGRTDDDYVGCAVRCWGDGEPPPQPDKMLKVYLLADKK